LDTAQLEFRIPSRGLIGFRTEFLTSTKGAGIANALAAGYEPWAGEIVTRLNGSLIAYRAGVATPFAVIALQERGSFFVSPTSEVYAGMVVGENSRSEDMEVNITKEKQLTNMRAASADNFVGLTPQKKLSLEECLEFAREDECVEVTPEATRIRKLELDANLRARAASARKNASKTS
jgi:GTP-binding protein